MAVGGIMNDMEFSDYGLGGPLLGAETVGVDLANPLLGGPEQGGLYTGGMGAGPSRTAAERQQAILNVNPYVAPSANMNLEPITSLRSGGQTGYYFANELGLPARFGEVGLPQPANPATFDPNAQYAATAPGFVPVDPNATYRLVEGGKNGDVVYAGEGGEGLRNVFEQANKLTVEDPKNAYWGVEVLNPDTGKFERVAENKGPNGLGIVGDIAGVALPVAAAIATGGASLGVQIAAGAAAGGLGGFLAGKDPLTSALIGGATAGLGNVTGANEAIGGVLGNIGDTATNIFASEAAKEAAKQAIASAGGDIVVTGLSGLAQGLGAGALQGAASGLTSNLSDITGYQTPAQKFVQQPVQQPIQEPVLPPAETAVEPIVVSGIKAGSGLPFASALPVPVEAILSGALTTAQPLPQQQPTTAEPEEIVVTAPQTVTPPMDIPVGSVLAGLGLTALPTPDTALTQKDGVLGTGLNIPQLISIGSIGADLLKNLLAGGGDTGPTTPYVSPFGTGAGLGLGTGRDMRASPNIIDYERYGFGPEAMFFQPGYGLLSSGAAAPAPAPALPQAQPIMATNPRYEPLI